MKNKELKTILKLAIYFYIGAFILWVLETTFFLIYEGWHLKATNPIEIFFDGCVISMFKFANIALTYYVLYKIFNYFK